MAQNPLIKRYLDAGMAFTQMTQARAEAIVKDLVKAGDVQTQRTEELVNAIVERSRQNTEKLLETVRKEVRDQIAALGLATKEDVQRLEAQLANQSSGTAKQAATKKRAAKKSTAKKSTAKKSTAQKSTSGSRSTKKASAAKGTASKSATKSSGPRTSS